MPVEDEAEPVEYLLEYQQVGNYVKVCAIDPRTGTEVSITGPASAGEATLRRNAVRKLRYVLAKNRAADTAAGSGGRGIVV